VLFAWVCSRERIAHVPAPHVDARARPESRTDDAADPGGRIVSGEIEAARAPLVVDELETEE
jgi:hypothetical protein